MKKSLIFSSAVALAMLINNSAYATDDIVCSVYVCNLSKQKLHFKKSYNYQANTDDDYSQDFVVAPNTCSRSVIFWGDNGDYRRDDQLQWTITNADTEKKLGYMDYHGDRRLKIDAGELKFIEYPKNSITVDDNHNYKKYKYYAFYSVNLDGVFSKLPFSHRTTQRYDYTYDKYYDVINDYWLSFRSNKNLNYTSGILQITDGIPESSKTFEDFEVK